MNIADVFYRLPSRYQLEEFLLYLSDRPQLFPELLEFVFTVDDPQSSFRALWACEKVSQRWPGWWTAPQRQRIRELALTTHHTGKLRLALSILNTLPQEDEMDVPLINKLYDYVLLPAYPPGVQSQAMRLLYALVKNNEDLKYEFFMVLEDAAEEFNSPAFRSTRKNLMKRKS
jgi:hypothetical protein